MENNLSEEQLSAWEGLCAGATPPPWVKAHEFLGPEKPVRGIVRPRPDRAEKYPPDRYGDAFREDIICGWLMSPRDVELITAAREGWPATLQEVRRLKSALEGEGKAQNLLLKGMESQAELADGFKQSSRKYRLAIEKALSLLNSDAPDLSEIKRLLEGTVKE